jgi:hypothetical protein
MMAEMAKGKNIIELRSELVAMPEFKLLEKIRTLKESLRIFKGNYAELRKPLVFHSDMPRALPLWDVRNMQVLYDFQREVARLLHNFVASAMSLVDHTRVLYRDLYEANGRFPEYKEEVKKRFEINPLASFVVCLRQYCQHYKPPPILSQMRWSQESPVFDSRLTLGKGNLEEFSGWKSPAKEFLAKQGDSIDLLDLVDRYYTLVMDFYRWFDKRQKEIHSEEFDKVNAKQKEFAKLVIPDMIQGALAGTAQHVGSPDGAFAAILTPQEWNELKKYSTNSPERCEKLIAFLEKRAPLDKALKKQVRQIYGIDF